MFTSFSKILAPLVASLCCFGPLQAMTWSGDPGPWGPGPMNDCVNTWNTYAYYGYNIPVVYGSGTPTADAGYMGQIRFGGQGNYRTAMHESAHWMGTGTTGQWGLHQRWSVWNGTYTLHLRRAYDGPGERQFIYGAHYGPQGANYDSEGVQAPQMVGTIGAFRRDMDLEFGDQTIGIASGTYRLRQRFAVKMLDSLGATTEGAQVRQGENAPADTQLWNVNLILGTRHFTLQNVASGKYLDSLGGADGAPVALTALAGGTPTDNQLWEIVQTDSFFFKIINKANGRALDNSGAANDGAGIVQWTAAGNFSWNQHWTFQHRMPQLPPPAGVISQGRWVSSSSTDGGNYDTKGNNGVSGDRWTAENGTFPQWWQVDLGSVQPITKVETDWFREGNGTPTFKYRIEVSDNGGDFTVAADRTGNMVVGTTVDQVITSGRYVRVVITGASAGYAAFYECRVYNEAQPMKLLSQHRPVSANSEQAGNLAVNANDVDPIFTRWCSASGGYPGWWQVDLGTAQQVNKAVIQWFDDDARSYQYRIEGSTDGVNYTTLLDRSDNTAVSLTTDNFSGVARFVRIHITGGSGSYPSIYEAQIFGSNGPALPAPANFTATPAASQIDLAWTAVAGATGYQVKRATTAGGPYTVIASPAGTAFSDTAVSAGIAYCYQVLAVNADGPGTPSPEIVRIVGGELHTYLPFDESAGSTAPDRSGNKRSGTLLNGALWAAGNTANAVDLDGTDDHAVLPAGVVSGLNDFTIAAWVNPDVNGNWARLFDFGTGTTNYMFLAPTNGTVLRFAIRTPAIDEQVLSAPPLPSATWSHVAVTLAGNSATLYVNGTSVATNNAMTLKPSSLGTTTNNWIGRAQFNDPYLNGKVDDFRIYNRALSVAEIGKLRGTTAPATLASLIAQGGEGKVMLNWSPSLGATSYNVKRSTVSGGPYSTVATTSASSYTDTAVSAGTPYFHVVSAVNSAGQESPDSTQVTATPSAAKVAPPAVLVAQEVGTRVKLAWSSASGAASYSVKRSTTGSGPFSLLGSTAATTYTDSTAAPGISYYYVVASVNANGEGADSVVVTAKPTVPNPEIHLKMDETGGTTTADISGNSSDGTLVNGPTRVAGRIDRAISFDGNNDHVTIPSGTTDVLTDCTLSVWVRPAALNNWARVFDFGTGTTNYMFLAAQGSTGKPVFSIRTPGTPEQSIHSSVALSLNTWNHIAITISGGTGTFYLNGVVTGANGRMSLTPASLGTTGQNYLGRSQFADPYFSGQLDEFQIRDRALTPTEVAALASPPVAPSGLTATAGGGQVSLAWNAVTGATGYTVRRSTVSGGPYLPVAADLVSPAYIDTAVASGTTYHYVVSAQKLVADSPLSAQASATVVDPVTPAGTWRQTHFGTTANTGSAADDEDPDKDGIVNLLERALGGNPNVFSADTLPAVDPSVPLLSIIYTRAKGMSDLTIIVQENADGSMSSWTLASGTGSVIEDLGDRERVRFTTSPGGAGQKFLRLRVTGNP